MIIVQQLRSARAGLRWSIEELAQLSQVSIRTIKMVEADDGDPQCRPSTLKKLVDTYEAAGIEFIGTPDNDPGIRIRTTKRNETL